VGGIQGVMEAVDHASDYVGALTMLIGRVENVTMFWNASNLGCLQTASLLDSQALWIMEL